MPPKNEATTHHHDDGCEGDPAEVPEVVWPRADHLLDVAGELVGAVEPRHGDRLEEADPEQRHPGRRVEVHNLEQLRVET